MSDFRAEELSRQNDIIGLFRYLGPMWIVPCMQISDSEGRYRQPPNSSSRSDRVFDGERAMPMSATAFGPRRATMGYSLAADKRSRAGGGAVHSINCGHRGQLSVTWRPAFRSPSSYLAMSPGRRNGNICLRSKTRIVGSIWRRRATEPSGLDVNGSSGLRRMACVARSSLMIAS
jgi:hypothetical protein